MSITPRTERWLNMAEDARSMANRMRNNQDGERILLEIANSYEELAAWAAKTDTVDAQTDLDSMPKRAHTHVIVGNDLLGADD